MCGIVGVIARTPVNQLIYDALLLLQHRGQDAAGIVTMLGTKCFMHKARGMVRDVFRTRNMRGAARARGPGAGALPDRRQRLQRGRGAALLRQRALRHRAGAQRQPDQRAHAEVRAVRHRPPPHQHRERHRGADQRAGARTGLALRAARRSRRRPSSSRGGGGAFAREGLVRGDRADRRPRAAGLPRPLSASDRWRWAMAPRAR